MVVHRHAGARRAASLLIHGLAFCILFAFSARAAVYQRTQLVFGDVELSIEITTSRSRESAFEKMERGFAIASRQNAIFSTYLPDSEISRLNALPKPVRNVRISHEMRAVLRQALGFTEWTHGYFDVTYEMPESKAAFIRLHGNRVDMLASDLRVNPTGLVKGDTVDRILSSFKRDLKISAATVAAGGDIGRFDRGENFVTVALHNPTSQPEKLKNVRITTGAVSTSGQYERGRHIVNTKASAVEHLQVSVVASDCTTSDALATAFLFMPLEEIRGTLQKFPGTRVLIYEKDGRILEL